MEEQKPKFTLAVEITGDSKNDVLSTLDDIHTKIFRLDGKRVADTNFFGGTPEKGFKVTLTDRTKEA